MKMKSHVLLAGYLLNYIPARDSVIRQKIFTLGCIEPDFNIFSYMKGFMRCHKLRGHNYGSSNSCISHMLKKLQDKKKWTLRDHYRLGKLMHYLADAFTYPHNHGFTGTLWEHRIYETRLHLYFESDLKQYGGENVKDDVENTQEFIADFHSQYLRSAGNFNNDAEFIIQVTNQVMRSLAHGLTPVCAKKEKAHYDNPDYSGLVCTNRQ